MTERITFAATATLLAAAAQSKGDMTIGISVHNVNPQAGASTTTAGKIGKVDIVPLVFGVDYVHRFWECSSARSRRMGDLAKPVDVVDHTGAAVRRAGHHEPQRLRRGETRGAINLLRARPALLGIARRYACDNFSLVTAERSLAPHRQPDHCGRCDQPN